MSPERKQSITLTVSLALSASTLLAVVVSALALGGKLERLNQAASSAFSITDAQMWVAQTERANTNWIGADVWQIWDRNHGERQSILGRLP